MQSTHLLPNGLNITTDQHAITSGRIVNETRRFYLKQYFGMPSNKILYF